MTDKIKIIENGVTHDVSIAPARRTSDVVFVLALLIGCIVALGKIIILLGGL